MFQSVIGRRRALFLALCLSLLLIGLSVAPRGISAAGCTTTVLAGGDIQAAIDAAGVGDVICLSAGTYSPAATLTVNKAVTLQGPQFDIDPRPSAATTRTPGSGEAIIDGGGTLGTIIQITSSDVALNGFEVKNGTGDLIASPVSGGITNVYIGYLIIHDATVDEGMQIRNCQDCTIEYNYIFDTVGDGINLCCDSTGGLIQFNETHAISSENAAIYIYDAEYTTIQCNVIDGTDTNDGIKLGSKNGSDAQKFGGSILYNVIDSTIEDGIAVYMSNTDVTGNDISYSTSENGAIYVAHVISNINITYNNVYDNSFSLDKWNPGAVTIGNSTGQSAATVLVNNNNFSGNTPNGVLNLAPDQLNAENNWWGAADGPGPSGPGSGDGVSGLVDYDPWLTAPVEIPAGPCITGGTITVAKNAGNTNQQFEFDPSWSDDNFFLNSGGSLTSDPLPAETYSVSEINLPAGWTLQSATCVNQILVPDSTDNGAPTADPSAIPVADGDNWLCTFTNVYTPPNVCNVQDSSALWTDILGKGMGNPKKHKAQMKLTIPNYTAVDSLYGQLVAKNNGNANYVRFIMPGKNNFVQVNAITSPAAQQAGNFWYGAYIDPAKLPTKSVTGRWFLQPSGTKGHIPRALVLYPTYTDPVNTWVNIWNTYDAAEAEVYWDTALGWTPTQVITESIAPPNGPTTFNVELALVDNDKDARQVWVTVEAGGVSQTQKPNNPNDGEQLNLMTFTLDVPEGTDTITITVYSPSMAADGVEGDSAALVGMRANYMCAPLD